MAAQNFEACLAHVLEFEGGYVNHPKDPGGATNMGITHLTLAAWRKVASVTPQQVKMLTLSEGKLIYRAQYWNAVKGDDLPVGLDFVIFDSAVNNGAGRSVRFLQTELKARGFYDGAIDGIIGAKSLNGLRQVNDLGSLIEAVVGRRLAFHRRLKGWATFGKGWQRRIDSVLTLALAMAGDWSRVNDDVNLNKPLVRPTQISDCRTPHDVAGACDVSAIKSVEGQGATGIGIGTAGAALSEAAAQIQPLAEEPSASERRTGGMRTPDAIDHLAGYADFVRGDEEVAVLRKLGVYPRDISKRAYFHAFCKSAARLGRAELTGVLRTIFGDDDAAYVAKMIDRYAVPEPDALTTGWYVVRRNEEHLELVAGPFGNESFAASLIPNLSPGHEIAYTAGAPGDKIEFI